MAAIATRPPAPRPSHLPGSNALSWSSHAIHCHTDRTARSRTGLLPKTARNATPAPANRWLALARPAGNLEPCSARRQSRIVEPVFDLLHVLSPSTPILRRLETGIGRQRFPVSWAGRTTRRRRL